MHALKFLPTVSARNGGYSNQVRVYCPRGYPPETITSARLQSHEKITLTRGWVRTLCKVRALLYARGRSAWWISVQVIIWRPRIPLARLRTGRLPAPGF